MASDKYAVHRVRKAAQSHNAGFLFSWSRFLVDIDIMCGTMYTVSSCPPIMEAIEIDPAPVAWLKNHKRAVS